MTRRKCRAKSVVRSKVSCLAASYAEIEDQMDRIVNMIGNRMGLNPESNPTAFRFTDTEGLVSGGMGQPTGAIWIDSGVLNPVGSLNAPELAQMSLRARIEVLLTHEAEEIPLLQQLGDPALSHPLTVMEAAPTTPLNISQEAYQYLFRWSQVGPYNSGIR